MQGVKYDGQGPSLDEINSLYRSILGRDADQAGLDYWDKSNLTLADLTNGLKGSEEYRAIQAKSAPQNPTVQAAAPKPVTAQQPVQQAQPKIAASQPSLQGVNYDGKGPSLDDINALYKSVLGREVDAAGLEYWDKTNFSLADLSRSLINSDEFKNSPNKSQLLRAAIARGDDLTGLYGGTYADSVRLLEDIGLGPSRYGKDNTIIVPASPTGYQGAWKFDPVFGSTYYRDAAIEMGRQLGIPESEVRKAAGKIAMDRLYTDNRQQRAMLGSTTADNLLPLLTGSLLDMAGVKDQKARDSVVGTVTQQVRDIGSQLYSVSDSSGFFKQIGKSIADLGPIGTIALTAALGPAGVGLGTVGAAAAAAAAPGVLQGDFEGALKSGALAGLSAGVLKGLDSTISNAVGGGIPGDIVGGAAKGAITGGAGALVTGGDFKDGLINGAIAGGTVAGVTSGVNALTQPGRPAVGGIDDSSNDLGKSTGLLESYGGAAVGDFNSKSYDETIRGITGQQAPVQPEIGGGQTQLVNRDANGNVTGDTVSNSSPPVGYTPSTGDFNIENYDRLISGISGTDLSGSDFGGGLAKSSGAQVGGGATQFVNRDANGNVTGTTVTTSGPSSGFGVSQPTSQSPKTGIGNVVGPVVGGLIANEIIGSRNNQQVNTPAVQSPAANAQTPQTQPVAGGATAAGPLDSGSFSVGASGSSGNGQAARLNLKSLFGDSMFAQQNEYLRSIL